MKTIAIIDDDIHIGDMLTEVLTQEGYAVLRAYSGTEALYLLSQNKPDLVLLDLMLQQSMSPTLNHKVWFLLDEFSLLPKVEALTDALSFARDPSGDNGRSGARIIAAVQSVQLLTRHYSEAEAKTLMSLFPNLITMRVMDPMSRAAFADRYGTARVIYRYMGEGNRPVTTDCEQKVVTDADFSQLMKPGQALMSLPAVSPDPFIYDGFRG
jgi:CheY-like chemotaxis protein